MLQVEKINNQKARIILTIDELAKHKITLKDIKDGKEKARNFFFEILEDSNLIEYFETDTNQLLIEATSKDNLFMITITKADCIGDIKNYSNISDSYSYTVSSNIYVFDTLIHLYNFCVKAHEEKSFIGINSLYKLANQYYIIFTSKTVKDLRFVKTFSLISEYSSYFYATTLHQNYLKEHSLLLIEKNAIQSINSLITS